MLIEAAGKMISEYSTININIGATTRGEAVHVSRYYYSYYNYVHTYIYMYVSTSKGS